MKPCKVLPAIPKYQKWRIGNSKKFIDVANIEQTAFQLINQQSGLFLDVSFYDGEGNVGVYQNENLDDQCFYFRFRGRLLAHGRLQNQKSGRCLHAAAGTDTNIEIADCQNAEDQFFSFYENGELVNKKSDLCVDVSGVDGPGTGDIQLYLCENFLDQM